MSPPNAECVVVLGVSGVGKTTVAKGIAAATGWTYAEGDAFHPTGNVAKMRAGVPLTDADRWPWLRAVRDWIDSREDSCVVTCSALKRAYRDLLREGHAGLRFCALQADPDLLLSRLAERTGHYMPPSLLRSQLDIYQPLEPDEPGVQVPAGGRPEQVVPRALAALGLASGR